MKNYKELAVYHCSDMLIQYWIDENDIVSLNIIPSELEIKQVERRSIIDDERSIESLSKVFKCDFPASTLENLVQLKVAGDPYPEGFSGGTSMRNSYSTTVLKYVEQQEFDYNHGKKIVTKLMDNRGITANHYLFFCDNDSYIEVKTELINNTGKAVTLEMLSSFSLGGLSPFQKDAGVGKYNIHRFQSSWSAEGRYEVKPAELLNLEKTWGGAGTKSLRFGQVGSMPVKGYFPFVAFEDQEFQTIWGAQLVNPGSWQLEVYRKLDMMNISGGLADREYGHWMKRLEPEECFKTPTALLSCCKGSIEDLTERFLPYQTDGLQSNEMEKDLPIIFNDWCTTWGHPSEKNITEIVTRLENRGVKYLVMDDGWFNDKPGCQQGLGDWNISSTIYPNGFKNLCDSIRQKGMIPGVWFEFENCTEGSFLYEKKEHLLHRDGEVLQVGKRRFLDFRDPWVHDYLYEKVIKMLKDNNIGYLKTDYNDTIGLGCDSAESLGEGLRAHLDGVQNFYRRLKEEIPELVLEICSSGGHRLEPSWMKIGDMGGFSDSHEGDDIPIIAANTQMMIPASKNQVWAVLRKEDSISRLYYSLAATFLGRMCLSGDIHDLDDRQMEVVEDAIGIYDTVKETIKHGHSRRFGSQLLSYTKPQGYQVVVRLCPDKKSGFLVVHGFSKTPSCVTIPLKGKWGISSTFKEENVSINLEDETVIIDGLKDYNGLVVSLELR